MTFVSDSWMIRYAARSTADGNRRAVPITNACVGTPACVAVSISTSSWARPRRWATRVDLVDAAQNMQDAAQLAQRVPARLLDGHQGFVRLLGSLCHHMRGDAGLDIDRGDAVRNHVV